MRTRTRSILIAIAAFLVLGTIAKEGLGQDTHYSQFYASPLTLNPALTGKVGGDYRIGAIYRSQWAGIAKPMFITPSASFDMPFAVAKKDAVGVGLLLLNDQSNQGRFKQLQIGLGGAYHKGLGANGRTQLSIGLQGAYNQKSLETSELTFGNMYDADLNLVNPNSENIAQNNVRYVDFNTGLLLSSQITDKTAVFVGGSLFHLFRPKENFTSALNGDNRLPRRLTVHGGFQFDFTEKISLYPGVLYMNQAKARELNFGTTLGYHIIPDLDNRTSIFIGGWYRLQDAAILQAGLEFKGFRLGFSYDINVSDLQTSTGKNVSAWEISLLYIGRFKQPLEENIYLFCPRF